MAAGPANAVQAKHAHGHDPLVSCGLPDENASVPLQSEPKRPWPDRGRFSLGFDRGGYSSRVSATESDLIAGAATTTSGNMVAQETSQDTSQFRKKVPADSDGTLAIPAAISDVNPDWMTPKTKWL
jgi:hypothetical protein